MVHPEPLPERRYQPLGKWEPAPSAVIPTVAVGLGILLGAGIIWALTRNGNRSSAVFHRRSPS